MYAWMATTPFAVGQQQVGPKVVSMSYSNALSAARGSTNDGRPSRKLFGAACVTQNHSTGLHVFTCM